MYGVEHEEVDGALHEVVVPLVPGAVREAGAGQVEILEVGLRSGSGRSVVMVAEGGKERVRRSQPHRAALAGGRDVLQPRSVVSTGRLVVFPGALASRGGVVVAAGGDDVGRTPGGDQLRDGRFVLVIHPVIADDGEDRGRRGAVVETPGAVVLVAERPASASAPRDVLSTQSSAPWVSSAS
jgi:hypothetical protein